MGKSTWTADLDQKLALLASEGKSSTEAGRIMGVTRCAVMGRALRIGIQFKGSRWGTYVRKPRPKSPPKPIIVTPDFAPLSRALSIEALSASVCHWPEGDGPTYSFCGHPIKPHSPYCIFHASKAFVPSTKRATK